MKKLLLILICSFQIITAQNTIVGEYISTTKNSNGVKLFFLEDNTYQISVFSGKYKIINDSIILENDSKENSFNLLFEKGKKATEKLTIKATPNNYYSLFSTEFLGIQKTENAEIEYKVFKDYFNENDLKEYTESIYNTNEKEGDPSENTALKLSFEIDRAYALYFVKYKERKSSIEKYIIPNDVNAIDVTIQDNYLADLELSGKIEKDKNIIFLTDGKSPLNFIKKSAIKNVDYISPSSKNSKKNWSFPGMKTRENYYDYNVDSTAVLIDSTANRFEFKAKVEKNLKEALFNIKKDTAKYLLAFYNVKDQKAEKNFNEFINNHNENVSYYMYENYNSEYDLFNFYLATKSDEAFFKKNNIKEKSVVVINNEGKIIASSTKSYDDIASILNYDSASLISQLKETENAIALSHSVTNKKTSIPDLTKTLNTNYKDFFANNNYFINLKPVLKTVAYSVADSIVENKELATITDSKLDYDFENENSGFMFYKPEISDKLMSEKLNTIFEYFNSKKIINKDLINILIGEISGNHINFDLFKNENNTNSAQEIKFINYILKYNEEENIKSKIAIVLKNIIDGKDLNNKLIKEYQEIATRLISFSENDFNIIRSAIDSYNEKEKGSEEASKLVDLYYTTLVNEKSVFENMDSQFIKMNASIDNPKDWPSFKYSINLILNSQAWDIFELNKTKDFERAIRWSELSNIVEKNNPYSLDTQAQLYFAVGRKQEAIAIQTKVVAIAKASGNNFEKFEDTLNNMKK